MNELFIKATINKYRFPFKGSITLEDLFDLSLEDLDKVYKVLIEENKKNTSETLLLKQSSTDQIVVDKINLVKYVFAYKENKLNEKLKEKERSQQKEKLIAAIAAKENDELMSKSSEELKIMLDNL